MFYRRCLFLFFAICMSALNSFSQQTGAASTQVVQRDPQALSILAQVLKNAGGETAIGAIQDFTASANVTYYWGDAPVQGTATIKGRGIHQFRLDAVLNGESHSWIFNQNSTFQRNPDQSISRLPSQNIVKPATAIFPLLQVASFVQDGSVSVVYGGLVNHNGQQVHDIVVQRIFAKDADSTGTLSKITKEHIFVNPSNQTIVGIQDFAYRRDGGPGEFKHEMQFSSYQLADGILVPFSVTESIADQQASTIQLTNISFNTGLADSDFE
jgi:outer membrane lipoprotein-sorting protein